MALTQSQEALRQRLNERKQAEHQEAIEKAERAGKPPPPAPVPLSPEHIEFPKYVHKDWKLSKKGNGHYEPSESRLVNNSAEHKAALAEGWTEDPTSKKK